MSYQQVILNRRATSRLTLIDDPDDEVVVVLAVVAEAREAELNFALEVVAASDVEPEAKSEVTVAAAC